MDPLLVFLGFYLGSLIFRHVMKPKRSYKPPEGSDYTIYYFGSRLGRRLKLVEFWDGGPRCCPLRPIHAGINEFNWGTGGAREEEVELAFVLLTLAGIAPPVVLQIHHAFAWEVISTLSPRGWAMTNSDIHAWVHDFLQRQQVVR